MPRKTFSTRHKELISDALKFARRADEFAMRKDEITEVVEIVDSAIEVEVWLPRDYKSD